MISPVRGIECRQLEHGESQFDREAVLTVSPDPIGAVPVVEDYAWHSQVSFVERHGRVGELG